MHIESLSKKLIAISLIALFIVGCSTPIDTSQSHTKVLTPDEADNVGGSFLESSDIRTISNQLSSKLLSLPEINESDEVVVIATEKITNSTRYIIDTNLLMRRIRLELNEYSNGKLRFLANRSGQSTRKEIFEDRNKEELNRTLDQIASSIATSSIVRNSSEPVVFSVSKVENTNLYNMNADSFASLLRVKIKEQAGDKVQFTRPSSKVLSDYTLTGEFFADSIKTEGIANPTNDLKWAQENQEKWRDNNSGTTTNEVTGNQINIGTGSQTTKVGPNVYNRTIAPELWKSPNVRKVFNVMLVDDKDIVVFEKSVDIEKEMKSGKSRASYILTGNISSLSKASSGSRSDYVLVDLFVIDPETNDMIMDYGYETKKQTTRSVIYR